MTRQATAAANPGARLFASEAGGLGRPRQDFTKALVSPDGRRAFLNMIHVGEDYGRLVDVARGEPVGPALRPQVNR